MPLPISPRLPSPQTTKRYGLTLDEWVAILDAQGGVCAVCKRMPASGRLNVDHEHVRGWKQMPPQRRKQYVRGLLCYVCNNVFLRRGATPERLRNAADYLEKYGSKGA